MESSPQLLKSGSDNFKSKLRNLFDTLATFEKDVNLPTEVPIEIEVGSPEWKSRARKNRKTTRAMRGQESLFKKPGLPPLTSKHNVPDFRRNPSRWTKYTLADVSPDVMTDASNTAAALSFLNSRKEISPDEEEVPARPQFKRVARINNFKPLSSSESSGFKDSKRIMPEYVVGEKKAKIKKLTPKPEVNEKKLTLSHLHEFEDDE